MKTKKNQKYSESQLGFSLIEMMLVTGIMSLIALGMANLFQINLKSQAAVAKGFQLENLHEEMRSFLANHFDCQQTWNGQDPTAVYTTPALIRAPIPPGGPTPSKFQAGAILGDGQVQIVKMTLDGSQYVPSSIPKTGVLPLVVDYKKVGEVVGLHDYQRKIDLNVSLDPVTGKISDCVAEAKMTDGIWRYSSVPDLPRKHIFYTGGTVAVNTETPEPDTLIHAHNPNWQGAIKVSGISDLGHTWSALYLADGNGDNKAAAGNNWVMAYKNEAAGIGTPERLDFVYQWRAAGSWLPASVGSTMSLIPPPPGPPVTSGTVAVNTVTVNPNTLMHLHNSISQGSVMISGVSDAGKTWSGLYLGDSNATTAANPGNSWAITYKKEAASVSPERLEFDYQTRAAGWALASSPAIMTLLKPGTNAGVPNGGLGIATTNPQATLDVNGSTILRGPTGISGNLAVTGTITATGTITSSDRRLKKDIKNLGSSMLGKIDLLEGVSYLRKDEKLNLQGREIGFIAQDVEKIFPEFVREDDKGMKAVNYSQMVAVLTEGIKELHRQTSQCSQENKDLKKQLSDMDARLLKLEKLLQK